MEERVKVPMFSHLQGGPQPFHPRGQQRLRVSEQRVSERRSCPSGRQRLASGQGVQGVGQADGRGGREQGQQSQRLTEAGAKKPLLTVVLGSWLSSTGLDGTTTGPRGCASHALQRTGGAYSASGLLRGSPPQQPRLTPHALPGSCGGVPSKPQHLPSTC